MEKDGTYRRTKKLAFIDKLQEERQSFTAQQLLSINRVISSLFQPLPNYIRWLFRLREYSFYICGELGEKQEKKKGTYLFLVPSNTNDVVPDHPQAVVSC